MAQPMKPATVPSTNSISWKEKILLWLTWMFLIGGAITAIAATSVVAKKWETRPFDATGLALLLFAFGFPAVHFAGYVWSRALAGVAGLLHAAWGALLVFVAAKFFVFGPELAVPSFFLCWAVFHFTLAVLMFTRRFKRGSQAPRQAAQAALADVAKSEAVRRRPTWHWRGYAIYSTFHNELADSKGKWQHWPVVRLLGWTVGWIPYLGIMVSALALSLLPTVALGSWFGLGPPGAVYWLFATLAALGSALAPKDC
jgi:hypothetical protein